ncbi:type II secretion system protein [Melaminivora alkalimesophila]|uniref:Prepilin-type N-terminal cleavage/methylation domain-containing protein n=1 Tax=Melaminivora alkalimesophila TaxID=1165852 RepID=A0A317RDX5_9BURK|nr:hypothetical protein [Melaminivora alkalimesophila]PWW47685.1 hypothetical protein DFR36_10258 [Melaminivora alkalimesophila]
MKRVASTATCGPTPSSGRHSGGFTLVEMALVLLIIGLLAFVFLPPSLAMLDLMRRKDTREKMQALQQALVRFVVLNQRLPCPADGSLGVDQTLSGVEQRMNAAGPTQGRCFNAAMDKGVVPWRSLGLDSALATDSWGNLITYRVWAQAFSGVQSTVETGLTWSGALDMSQCDPSGGTPPSGPGLAMPGHRCQVVGNSASAPLTFLAIKPGAMPGSPEWRQMRGFGICRDVPCPRSIQSDPPGANEVARRVDGNGAAYVLISHGGNRYGAYNVSGTLINAASGPGPREGVNANGRSMNWSGPTANPNVDVTFYIDAEYDESESNYFDDIVVRASVLEVAIAAGLGPRPGQP